MRRALLVVFAVLAMLSLVLAILLPHLSAGASTVLGVLALALVVVLCWLGPRLPLLKKQPRTFGDAGPATPEQQRAYRRPKH